MLILVFAISQLAPWGHLKWLRIDANSATQWRKEHGDKNEKATFIGLATRGPPPAGNS
jgi:hypothetical protein